METKLKARELQAEQYYLAFSAKSKMLSSNANRGVFVRVKLVEGPDVTVEVLHSGRVMVIKNLDSREDAWMYSPSQEKVKVVFNQKEPNQIWPKFTQKMIDNGWTKRELTISLGDVELSEREGYEGTPFLYHEYEEEKHIMTRLGWLQPVEAPVWRVPRAERMGLGAVEIPLPPKHEGALVSEEFLTNLRPFMEDFKTWAQRGTCGYFFFDDKMERKEDHKNQPCHASVGRVQGKWSYIVTNHRKGDGITDDMEASYITYLTEYSPYKDIFLVKDVEYIRENGYVLSLDTGAEFLASALFATRQIWEHPWVVIGGFNLYKARLNPKAAFLFGVATSVQGGGKCTFTSGSLGHCHIGISSMSDACIKNYLLGTPEKPGENFKKVNTYAYKVNKIWSSSEGSASSPYKALAKISPKGARGITVAEPYAVICDKAADVIEEWLDKEGVIL